MEFGDLRLTNVVFGIRFGKQFALEDLLGAVIDRILAEPDWGSKRFPHTTLSAAQRQLVGVDEAETLTFTCNDAIYESRNLALPASELPSLATSFTEVAWKAVTEFAPKTPAINRFGCVVGFELPEDWSPIQSLLSAEASDTSEFAMRYSRRFPIEKALAVDGVNDYGNVIYFIRTQLGKSTASIDYQRYFDPALDNDKSRGENPYPRFVEKAVAFHRTGGWDFLKSRIERIRRAA